MQRLAILRRQASDGNVRNVAVNPQAVRYVIAQDYGAYITFDHEHSEDTEAVTPIGIKSPDRFETVRRQLNKPYWTDLLLRIVGLVLSAGAIAVAIWFKSA